MEPEYSGGPIEAARISAIRRPAEAPSRSPSGAPPSSTRSLWDDDVAGRARQTCVPIECDVQIVDARQQGRELATELGFSSGEATLVATVISELARNIVLHARRGMVVMTPIRECGRCGMLIVARDDGRGIADLPQAMSGGRSTTARLGVGLSGVKRIMDEFEIVSEVGRGTTVIATRWKR